jgi:hypothetical protein
VIFASAGAILLVVATRQWIRAARTRRVALASGVALLSSREEFQLFMANLRKFMTSKKAPSRRQSGDEKPVSL